jgi:hypothetical protein
MAKRAAQPVEHRHERVSKSERLQKLHAPRRVRLRRRSGREAARQTEQRSGGGYEESRAIWGGAFLKPDKRASSNWHIEGSA